MNLAAYLDELMEFMKVKQDGLAFELGVKQPTISRWVNGAEPKPEHYQKLVELAQKIGFRSPDTDFYMPVEGYIGAGAEVFVLDGNSTEIDYIKAPIGMTGGTCLVVRGDSMYPKFEDGDMVVIFGIQHDLESLIGQYCYVKLQDGRIFLKQLRRGSSRGLYSLFSHNAPPIEDVTVEIAFPIVWTQPKHQVRFRDL